MYFISGGHKPANAHQWGPGVRDVYALHYIIRGQGTLETGGRVFRLVTGESFIIFPQKEIYYYPDPQDPWEYVWVEFSGEDAGRLLGLTQLSEVQPVVSVSPETLQPFSILPGTRVHHPMNYCGRMPVCVCCFPTIWNIIRKSRRWTPRIMSGWRESTSSRTTGSRH
ncbi:AraC family ligand binding domain-containing protein [Paenibacillus amylolyticus]|nr:AraC family ligand binding domain-containing protein [Paenibacillus amylolyticus]